VFTVAENKTVISVKEARKLLGQKSKNLTNEDLEALILDTETVVRIAVSRFIGSINSKSNGTMGSERANQ